MRWEDIRQVRIDRPLLEEAARGMFEEVVGGYASTRNSAGLRIGTRAQVGWGSEDTLM